MDTEDHDDARRNHTGSKEDAEAEFLEAQYELQANIGMTLYAVLESWIHMLSVKYQGVFITWIAKADKIPPFQVWLQNGDNNFQFGQFYKLMNWGELTLGSENERMLRNALEQTLVLLQEQPSINTMLEGLVLTADTGSLDPADWLLTFKPIASEGGTGNG